VVAVCAGACRPSTSAMPVHACLRSSVAAVEGGGAGERAVRQPGRLPSAFGSWTRRLPRLSTTGWIHAFCSTALTMPPNDEYCPASHEQDDSDSRDNAALTHDCCDKRGDRSDREYRAAEKIHPLLRSAAAVERRRTVPPHLSPNRSSVSPIRVRIEAASMTLHCPDPATTDPSRYPRAGSVR
jgi:hypothetical protein